MCLCVYVSVYMSVSCVSTRQCLFLCLCDYVSVSISVSVGVSPPQSPVFYWNMNEWMSEQACV